MDGEDRLLERLAEDPSPYADLALILAAAKPDGASFEAAWKRAMRAVQPPRGVNGTAAAELKADRMILRELRTTYRAAYEDREQTDAELGERDRFADRRVAALLGEAA